MDLRNVQKTGKMFYVYLPTQWCKKYSINSNSKLEIEEKSDGSLTLYPIISNKNKKKHLHIDLSKYKEELSSPVLNKIIVASYISPINSFRIDLNRDLNMNELFDKKDHLNIEFVEFGKKHVSCETTISIQEPFALLKAMVKKIRSMLYIMLNNYNKELVLKYEDDIDKSKLLIEKSVVYSMTISNSSNMKPIELYFTSSIAKELERFVDHIKEQDKKENKFFKKMHNHILLLEKVLLNIESSNKDYSFLLEYLKEVNKIHEMRFNNPHKIRIMSSLRIISEVLTDWIVMINIE